MSKHSPLNSKAATDADSTSPLKEDGGVKTEVEEHETLSSGKGAYSDIPSDHTRGVTDRLKRRLEEQQLKLDRQQAELGMASTDSLKIKPFSGEEGEDGRLWLKRFNQWLSLKTFKDDDQKKGSMEFHLIGKANDWHESLGSVDKKTYATLEAAFKKRYFPSADEQSLRLGRLFASQQQPNEPVLDYLSGFIKEARYLEIDEAQILKAATAGLKRDIHKELVLAKPATLTDMIERARLVEISLGGVPSRQPTPPDPSINSINTEILTAISALTQKFDNLDSRLNAVEHPRSVRFDDQRDVSRDRYDRNRNGYYDRYRGRSPSYDRHHNMNSDRGRYRGRSPAPYNRRDDSWERHRGRRDDSRDRYSRRSPSRDRYSRSSRDRYDDRDDRRGDNRDQRDRARNEGSSQRGPPRECRRCGVSAHDTNECPHFNTVCTICRKRGHISNVCWHAKPSNDPNNE